MGRTGFEPVTSSVSGKRSPAELTARNASPRCYQSRTPLCAPPAPRRPKTPPPWPPTIPGLHVRPSAGRLGRRCPVQHLHQSYLPYPITLATVFAFGTADEYAGRMTRFPVPTAPEGRLAVVPGRDQPVASRTPPGVDVAQEAGDGLVSLVVQRDRRHRTSLSTSTARCRGGPLRPAPVQQIFAEIGSYRFLTGI